LHLKGIQVRLPTLSLAVFDGKTYFQLVSVARPGELSAKDQSEHGDENRQSASGFSQDSSLQLYADHSIAS
jgi:hypothetical protein